MASTMVPEPLIFSFPLSIFSRRVQSYLLLRPKPVPYTLVPVEPNMPRPLLQEGLDVQYRRIPVVAIGKDIYCDTRCIITALERLFPDGRMSSGNSFEEGFADMVENWANDGGPFWRTSGCIPVEAPCVSDPVWMQDRLEGSGGMWTRDKLIEDRPWCVSQMGVYFDTVEAMLRDGREWLCGTDRPGLADVHGVWCFDWAINIRHRMMVVGAKEGQGLDENVINDKKYPNTYAWVRRYGALYQQKLKEMYPDSNGTPPELEGQAVVERILSSSLVEADMSVESTDPIKLRQGQRVKIHPVDFGFTHVDEGLLVGLSTNEVIVQKGELRLHFPRVNFKITPVGSNAIPQE